MKAVARLTSKRQITLPKRVRQALGVDQGDGIEFDVQGERVIVRGVKPKRSSSGFLHRLLPRKWRPPTVEKMDEGIGRVMRRKHAHR